MGGRAEEESFWAEEWEAGVAGSRVIPRHLETVEIGKQDLTS